MPAIENDLLSGTTRIDADLRRQEENAFFHVPFTRVSTDEDIQAQMSEEMDG